MATPEEKKSKNELKREQAEQKARDKQDEMNRQELLDTISGGFKSILKTSTSIEKLVDKQTEIAKKNADITKKMSSDIAKYVESSGKKLERTADYSEMAAKRLGTLLQLQRENNANNVVVIDNKQFDIFQKYFDSSSKRLERAADYTHMTGARLGTLIDLVREEGKDEDVKIADAQWEVFKKIRERLVKIQMHTDNASSRIWVLQDLTKLQTKEISKIATAISKIDLGSGFNSFPTWFEIYCQKPLNRLYDLISSGNNTGGSGATKFDQMQFTSLMSKLDSIAKNDKLYQLLGAGAGNAAGHLHHIRALLQTAIRTIRNTRGFRVQERESEDEQPRTESERRESNRQAGQRMAQIVAPWLRDLGTLWNRFTNNFMGVFQRGIVGRLTSMNPLIGMVTDVIRDVGTTISDIAGTFWQTYLLFSHLMQNRAAIGSGVTKVKDNVVGKYQALVEGLSKVGQMFMMNFGSISAIGTTIARGFSFIKGGFGDVAAMFGRGLMNTITSFASGGFRGMLGDLNKFASGSKLGKILKPLEYIQSIFYAFGDVQEFVEKGSWFKGLMAGGIRIAFTSLKMLIDLVIDIPTQILSWVTGALGFDKLSNFLNQDFSSMIIDTAMSGIKGLLNLFNEGFASGLRELGGLLKFIVWDSWSEDIKFGEVFFSIFNSIQQWLIDSYNNVIGFLPEAFRPEPIGSVNVDKVTVIPADSTKNAQQALEESRTNATVNTIVGGSATVISAPAPAAIPYSTIPASNPDFNTYS